MTTVISERELSWFWGGIAIAQHERREKSFSELYEMFAKNERDEGEKKEEKKYMREFKMKF